MRYQPLPSSFHKHKRKQTAELISQKALVVLFSNDLMPKTGDQFYPFRQDSNLLYLSGLDQEECCICFEVGQEGEIVSEVAFIPETNALKLIWDGPRFTLKKAKEISGIDHISWNDKEEEYLNKLIKKHKTVYLNTDDFFKFSSPIKRKSNRMYEAWSAKYSDKEFLKLDSILNLLRPIKEKEEIEQMKKASNITKEAFKCVLQKTRPGMKEYQIEAILTSKFLKYGAVGHAYLPIIASGKNACVLHYIKNDDNLDDGDLILMDFGAEYANYAADCSRTIPVNGKFSPRQKECYEAVLRTFLIAKKLFVPGNTINKINAEVNKMMEAEMIHLGLFSLPETQKQDPDNPLYTKYFMHGTSHFLGLDVHDVGAKDRPFEKGMVLTCEPGLYIAEENIGIRIENNIVVDDQPIDLMEDIPLQVDEIEALMSK